MLILKSIVNLLLLILIFTIALNINKPIYTFNVEKIDKTIQEIKELKKDKFQHFTTTFIASFLIQSKLDHDNSNIKINIFKNNFIVLFFSLLKEVYDATKPNNKFSFADLIFDLIGFVFGVGVATIYRKIKK